MFDMFHSAITRGWFSSKAIAFWSDEATIQGWIDAELALAQAQGELGIIPADICGIMRQHVQVGKFDLDKMAAEIAAILHPLVPFLRQFEAMCPPDVAGYLHWGVTTQNIFETGAALQLRHTHAKIMEDLNKTIVALAELARQHAGTVQAGRTHGQHAVPVTFGYRLAGWAVELERQQDRIQALLDDACVAHYGGAAGTFGAMNGRGREVQARAAAILGLSPTRVAARSNFDGVASYMAALAVLAGLIEKMAVEISFLQRTEIAEVHERHEYGIVGSSTMAQKRNPTRANNITGMARLLKARLPIIMDSLVRLNDADSVSSNLADVTVPEIAVMAASIAEKWLEVVAGLHVDVERMLANFQITNGLIMSEAIMMELAPQIGRGNAHHVLYDAVSAVLDQGGSFEEAIGTHKSIQAATAAINVAELVDPQRYVHEARDWVMQETSGMKVRSSQ